MLNDCQLQLATVGRGLFGGEAVSNLKLPRGLQLQNENQDH